MNDDFDSLDEVDVKRAVESVAAFADSGSAADVPLRCGETLNQCLSCGRRIITGADEPVPTVACRPDGDQMHRWIAVREQNDPAPFDPPTADITERWPIDAADAREFLQNIGYQPQAEGWSAGQSSAEEGQSDG